MDKAKWTPADLLQLSGGYWAACALHAAVRLDLFTRLSKKSLDAAQAAAASGTDPRGTAMLLDSLSAMGLLEKAGDSYVCTGFAAAYLSRDSEKYLGHIIQHHHHLMEGWAHLHESVKSGAPVRGRVSHEPTEQERESFLMGMFNLAMHIAPRLVPQIDLSDRRRLLDLGGGPGTYAIHFCLHNPSLEATIYDLPSTRGFAESTVARFGLSDRISFREGDFIDSEIPGKYDVAWLSHVLHGEGPDACGVLLRKAVGALEDGGTILVQEFILDDAKDGPVFPALFSLNMLLVTPHGQAYSESEIRGMLEAAGVTDLRRLPVDLPNGAGVIAGTVRR